MTDYPLDDAPFFQFGLIVQPDGRGGFAANVPLIGYHSTEFSIGYGGSGPAELALATLAACLPAPTPEEESARLDLRGGAYERAAADPSLWSDELGPCKTRVNRLAFALHQDFKRDFLSTMPDTGGSVRLEDIERWLRTKKAMVCPSAQ